MKSRIFSIILTGVLAANTLIPAKLAAKPMITSRTHQSGAKRSIAAQKGVAITQGAQKKSLKTRIKNAASIAKTWMSSHKKHLAIGGTLVSSAALATLLYKTKLAQSLLYGGCCGGDEPDTYYEPTLITLPTPVVAGATPAQESTPTQMPASVPASTMPANQIPAVPAVAVAAAELAGEADEELVGMAALEAIPAPVAEIPVIQPNPGIQASSDIAPLNMRPIILAEAAKSFMENRTRNIVLASGHYQSAIPASKALIVWQPKEKIAEDKPVSASPAFNDSGDAEYFEYNSCPCPDNGDDSDECDVCPCPEEGPCPEGQISIFDEDRTIKRDQQIKNIEQELEALLPLFQKSSAGQTEDIEKQSRKRWRHRGPRKGKQGIVLPRLGNNRFAALQEVF